MWTCVSGQHLWRSSCLQVVCSVEYNVNHVRYVQDFNWHTFINNDSIGQNTGGNSEQIISLLDRYWPCYRLWVNAQWFSSAASFLSHSSWSPPPSLPEALAAPEHIWCGLLKNRCCSPKSWFLQCIQWSKGKICKYWRKKRIDMGVVHVTNAVFFRNKVLFYFYPKWYKARSNPSDSVKLSQLGWNFIFQT